MTILLQGAGLQIQTLAGDPIGDGLRADAVAYWTMDESGLDNRLDSTSHHLDLSLDYTVPIPNDVGKIGNCGKWVDDTGGNFSDLQTLTLGGTDFTSGIAIACWIKTNQFVPADDGSTVIARINDGVNPNVISLSVGIIVPNQPEMGTYTDGLVASPLSAGDWHLVIYWKDSATDGTIHAQVDNGTVIDGACATYANPVQLIVMGFSSQVNNVDTVWIDEVLLLARAPTSDERNYLWNSGAGRALFPAP